MLHLLISYSFLSELFGAMIPLNIFLHCLVVISENETSPFIPSLGLLF